MFLVAVDAYSNWPQVVLMQSTTAAKTIDALRQMFAMHGLPEHIVSDNGPQFTAEEFAAFLRVNGVQLPGARHIIQLRMCWPNDSFNHSNKVSK